MKTQSPRFLKTFSAGEAKAGSGGDRPAKE
jgi:hypothetical protein